MSYDELLKLEPSNLCPSCKCKPACLPDHSYALHSVYFECMNEKCKETIIENKEWIEWESEMMNLIENVEEEEIYCDVCGLDYTSEDPCLLH